MEKTQVEKQKDLLEFMTTMKAKKESIESIKNELFIETMQLMKLQPSSTYGDHVRKMIVFKAQIILSFTQNDSKTKTKEAGAYARMLSLLVRATDTFITENEILISNVLDILSDSLVIRYMSDQLALAKHIDRLLELVTELSGPEV